MLDKNGCWVSTGFQSAAGPGETAWRLPGGGRFGIFAVDFLAFWPSLNIDRHQLDICLINYLGNDQSILFRCLTNYLIDLAKYLNICLISRLQITIPSEKIFSQSANYQDPIAK